jgi:hypothetical protein
MFLVLVPVMGYELFGNPPVRRCGRCELDPVPWQAEITRLRNVAPDRRTRQRSRHRVCKLIGRLDDPRLLAIEEIKLSRSVNWSAGHEGRASRAI